MSIRHKVKQGDCIASIAYEHGLFPDTVWDDPDNADLKKKRKNPNILLEGDVVVIPEKCLKEETVEAAKRHRFRRKGVPETFRLKLLDNGIPRKCVNYVIDLEGTLIQGATDDQGWLEHTIPPDAKKGKLLIEGDEDEVTLLLGALPPVEVEEGVNMRLINLGFLDEDDRDDEDARKDAIAEFQEHCGLPVTGQIDEDTRKKLTELHQS